MSEDDGFNSWPFRFLAWLSAKLFGTGTGTDTGSNDSDGDDSK